MLTEHFKLEDMLREIRSERLEEEILIGEQKKEKEIVLNMLKAKFPIETIASIADISIEKVRELAQT